MGKKTSSKLTQVFIVVLLLCNLIYHTESAFPSHHQQHSITSLTRGRRMMAYNPNGGIKIPLSKIKGRRLEKYYKPNREIFTGPSYSGHGGGSIDQVSSP